MSIEKSPLSAHSNDFSPERIGFSFIKPGYERVFAPLTEDFLTAGLRTIQARALVMAPEVVDYIYRESIDRHFYPTMRQHLVSSAVIAIIVGSEVGNAQRMLESLKRGDNGYENLRKKYGGNSSGVSNHELGEWKAQRHPDQDTITIRLTQKNVFHSADDTEDALKSIGLVREYHPEFFSGQGLVTDVGALRTVERHLSDHS